MSQNWHDMRNSGQRFYFFSTEYKVAKWKSMIYGALFMINDIYEYMMTKDYYGTKFYCAIRMVAKLLSHGLNQSLWWLWKIQIASDRRFRSIDRCRSQERIELTRTVVYFVRTAAAQASIFLPTIILVHNIYERLLRVLFTSVDEKKMDVYFLRKIVSFRTFHHK